MKTVILIDTEQVEKFLADHLCKSQGVELESYGFIEKYSDGSGEGPLDVGGKIFFKAVTI